MKKTLLPRDSYGVPIAVASHPARAWMLGYLDKHNDTEVRTEVQILAYFGLQHLASTYVHQLFDAYMAGRNCQYLAKYTQYLRLVDEEPLN